MTPFDRLTALAMAMPADNIDTDQILPGRFLKTIQRQGLGDALFYHLRNDTDETPIRDHPLNRLSGQGLRIIVAGDNFGCGSSREHAPWALQDYGIAVVIAPTFADIFYNNCINCGLLPAQVSTDDLAFLLDAAGAGPIRLAVDLTDQTITGAGRTVGFAIAQEPKRRLLGGIDPISESLEEPEVLAAFEARRARAVWLR